MTIRSYIWGMRFCTFVALAALGMVIYFINPTRDEILGQTLFYISLFFSITGIATLFLFWLRRTFSKNETAVQENVRVSFRQGALVAAAVCLLLILQSFRLLVWWDGGIVVAGILLIELWFLSRQIIFLLFNSKFLISNF